MTGAERIAAERQRQMEVEGWTVEHDAEHTNGELVDAAVCYAANNDFGSRITPPDYWPTNWADSWWKPSDDPIRNLEKAGALIAAEIDRLIFGGEG